MIGYLAKPETLDAAGVERVFAFVPCTPNLAELETKLLNAIKFTGVCPEILNCLLWKRLKIHLLPSLEIIS
jgi:hypothetical protein